MIILKEILVSFKLFLYVVVINILLLIVTFFCGITNASIVELLVIRVG